MNYEETRQVALMRIAEMGRVLEQCGLKLRDEYTLDDALEFAGKRVLEIIDDGYAAMLALMSARSHVGRRVSDDVLFVSGTMFLTAPLLERISRDIFSMSHCPASIDNPSIKYNVINRPSKKKRIKSSNIFADVTFELPDGPVKWRIPSAIDEDAGRIPNLKGAHINDTVINSPTDDWQMRVRGVKLISHMSECLVRCGARLGLYFYEVPDGCYVIAKSPGDIYEIKVNTGLTFFPVPEPDYDDELFERDEEMARTREMDPLTTMGPEMDAKFDADSPEPIKSDTEKAISQKPLDDFEKLLAAAFHSSTDATATALPEIASAPANIKISPDDTASADDDSTELDPELVEQLGYESETVHDTISGLINRFAQGFLRAMMLPGVRADLKEREYMEVRDQLVQLAQRGLRMNTGYLLREVIKREGIKPVRLKRLGWEGLLWFLCGVDSVDGEVKPYSDDIILYDYHDYCNRRLLIELTRHIQRMTRGELHFGSVVQHNDKYGRPVAFEFVQGGKKHKWKLRTDTGGAQLGDYFERMAELMRDNGCSGNLWYFERRSKCYYMYVSRKNGLRLRKLTGLPLQAVLRE